MDQTQDARARATTTRWVGIDVAKRHLDVVVLPDDLVVQVTNDAAGWATLLARLGPDAITGVVVEATGHHHVGVTLALAEAGMPAAVVNPERTHAFARSEGRRAKTDRHDARLLARFGQQKQPAPSAVLNERARQLRDQVACREALTKMLVAEKNRVQTASDPLVVTIHEAVMAELGQQLARLEQAIAETIATDAELAERRRVLQTTPGVGPAISAVLVTGVPELGIFSKQEIASLAGIAPHPRDSGTSQGKRSIVGGRRQVRKALYQMALTASRHEPTIRAHYQQLCRRCPPKVALIACARRMLGILTVMLREGITWQETKVGQGHFLPAPA